jgi:ubiquinone/menaquinone biosynthesis C-methylase UbiE
MVGMKNAFGSELFEIKAIVSDRNVNVSIQSLFFPVLTYLGLQTDKAKKIIADCLDAASNCIDLEDYESQAHGILEKEKVAEKIPSKLQARANTVYQQIEPHLLAGNVLDYGCGDGQVGELITKNKKQEVALADVYEHGHIKETKLKFYAFKQGQTAPFTEEQFGNTLAITVFHHSSNPLASLQDVYRVTKTGGRVIVIESVYGVTGKKLNSAMQKKAEYYLSLSGEQQRKVNIFFDHFYNRVLHYNPNAESKVNVPFNFNTPQGWAKIFSDCGFQQEAVVHLGLDQPTVPEYHTLHVLRKN